MLALKTAYVLIQGGRVMVQAAAKKLIFRLGEVGFVLDLACIVEVCEHIVDTVDFRKTDLDSGIVGSLLFRRTLIPVIDPTLRLELSSSTATGDKVVLVLRSSEGNWALLVDQDLRRSAFHQGYDAVCGSEVYSDYLVRCHCCFLLSGLRARKARNHTL